MLGAAVLLAFALPCGAVPAGPDLSGDPAGGIGTLQDDDIIIWEHDVYTSVAYGTVAVNRLFPSRDALRSATYVSDELAARVGLPVVALVAAAGARPAQAISINVLYMPVSSQPPGNDPAGVELTPNSADTILNSRQN